jgi:hypothetical protein
MRYLGPWPQGVASRSCWAAHWSVGDALTAAEKAAAKKLAEKYGQAALEDAAPIQMVGSGANLNEATDNGVARLAELLDMPAEEVLNRVTVSGAVEIGRLPGVVTVTMLAPLDRLEKGLAELVKEQYGL